MKNKKTLVIKYTPREAKSNTKKLLDHAIQEIENENTISILDLTVNTPDYFLKDNLQAYYKRNYGRENLSREESKSIAKMDEMTKQFIEADIIIIATPMYNFSTPGIVKAYFDSIMQKGRTWDIGESGYIGLMKEKKALILTTSGGVYENEMARWEHSESLMKTEFQFMGFSHVESISAAGINMIPAKAEEIINHAKSKITEILSNWD